MAKNPLPKNLAPIHFLTEHSTAVRATGNGPTIFKSACRSTVARDGEVKREPTMTWKREEVTCRECRTRLRRDYRECRFCGQPFEPPKPGTRHCRSCHYQGRLQGETHEALMDALWALLPDVGAANYNPDAVEIRHTGGGCFGLAITLPDGRLVFGTEATQEADGTWVVDAGCPEPGGFWGLGIYASEDAFMDGETDEDTFTQGLTDAEVIAKVRDLIAGR